MDDGDGVEGREGERGGRGARIEVEGRGLGVGRGGR